MTILAVATLLSASVLGAAKPPAWINRTPSPDTRFIYAVGAASAKTKDEAERLAMSDALGKLAAQIRITVTAMTIDSQSTQNNDLLAETRSSARAQIRDAEPIGQPWTEVIHGHFPLFLAKGYRVHVLVRYPRQALDQERHREDSAWTRYRAAIDGLAKRAAQEIDQRGLSAVAVGGFKEAATERAYTMSHILAHDLADGLIKAGISPVDPSRAKTIVTGVYRVVGPEIIVSMRIERLDTREEIGVFDAAFDVDAIEPQWLSISAPIDSTFEMLEPRPKATPLYGSISVDSKPSGARIFVDGEDRGRTPVDLRDVPVGYRSITLVLDGYEPYQRRIRVVEDEKTPVEAELLPKTGDLEVRSTPSGEDVVIDGRSRGTTPLHLRGVRVGTYTLVLQHKDYEEAKVEVTVKHRETTTKDVALTEEPGAMFVVSDPPGATILIDGVDVGKTMAPNFLKVDDVRAGLRRIDAVIPGRGSWQGTARVRAHEVVSVTAPIADQRGSLYLSVAPADAEVYLDHETTCLPSTTATPRNEAPPAHLTDDAMMKSLEDRLLASVDRINAQQTFAISLLAGKHRIKVRAGSYRTVNRTVRVRAGEVKRLAITLDRDEDAGARIKECHGQAGSIMPWTSKFGHDVPACSSGDPDYLTCGLTWGTSEVITLGLYPTGGDLIALPFRILARSAKAVGCAFAPGDNDDELRCPNRGAQVDGSAGVLDEPVAAARRP